MPEDSNEIERWKSCDTNPLTELKHKRKHANNLKTGETAVYSFQFRF